MRTGLPLIKQFEGCKLKAYRDIVGIPTIGYGFTRGVKMGQTITQAEADARLLTEYDLFDTAVALMVKVPMTDNQRGALTSLAFNIGVGNLRASTLMHKMNDKDYQGAHDQFRLWDHAGHKVITGLTVRRAVEAVLFAKA